MLYQGETSLVNVPPSPRDALREGDMRPGIVEQG